MGRTIDGKEEKEMGWILTYTGRAVCPLAPHPKEIDPIDIAHALSHVCRFAGHTRQFYSVAQHCCLVAELVPPQDRLAALLHDATEAYISDLASPVKAGLPQYREAERVLWEAIATRFGISRELPVSVKHADLVALATERRDLMPHHATPWKVLEGIQPVATRIFAVPPEVAKAFWLNKFQVLAGGILA